LLQQDVRLIPHNYMDESTSHLHAFIVQLLRMKILIKQLSKIFKNFRKIDYFEYVVEIACLNGTSKFLMKHSRYLRAHKQR